MQRRLALLIAVATFAAACGTGTESTALASEPAATTEKSAPSTVEPAIVAPTLDPSPLAATTVVPARFTPEPSDAASEDLGELLIGGEDAPASTRFASLDEAISSGVETNV
jgi:hypothetical protein